MGGDRGEVEDRGIGRSSSSRTRKKNMFGMWKGGDKVSADAALEASALTVDTANNGRQNVF